MEDERQAIIEKSINVCRALAKHGCVTYEEASGAFSLDVRENADGLAACKIAADVLGHDEDAMWCKITAGVFPHLDSTHWSFKYLVAALRKRTFDERVDMRRDAMTDYVGGVFSEALFYLVVDDASKVHNRVFGDLVH